MYFFKADISSFDDEAETVFIIPGQNADENGVPFEEKMITQTAEYKAFVKRTKTALVDCTYTQYQTDEPIADGLNSDIVNIALHISLKNFEQQCNGINIHFATLRGYLFHCGRRFALLIRVISTSLLCRRHSANGRTYPAVIPIAHVVAPDHCFQLVYRVIRTSSAAAVKQLVLHSRPHTFAAGVVMTSASGAIHALPYSILVQRSSV